MAIGQHPLASDRAFLQSESARSSVIPGESMARPLLSSDGGTVGHSQEGAKLSDQSSISPNKPNCSALICRRSARLREITSVYESEAANAVKFSLKLEHETNKSNSSLSSKQKNIGRSQSQFRHSPQKGLKHAVEVIDSDDEISTTLTLRDLQTRWKFKKREASKANGREHDMQMHYNACMENPKEEDELEEAIYSLKVKMDKSSPTIGKRRKCSQPSLHYSSNKEKFTEVIYSSHVASLNGLNAASLMEENSDELSTDCKVDLEHKIESSLHGEMEAFTEQSPDSVENCEPSPGIKKYFVETYFLDESDAEKSRINCTTNTINKCYFDIESSAEVFKKVIERGLDSTPPASSISNIMDPFAIDLIEQNRQCFSPSSSHKPESCKIISHEAFNVKNEHLLDGSTDCESTTPRVELVAELKHQRNFSVEVTEEDGEKELQFEDSILTEENIPRLIAANNSIELLDSDSEKFTCSIKNCGSFVGDSEICISHKSFNKNTVSSISKFKSSSCDDIDGSVIDSDSSLSVANHNIFVGEMKNGSDKDCSTVSGNCGDPVNDFMGPTSNCSANNLSRMGCNNLSSDILDSSDISVSVTEAEDIHFNPVYKDRQQSSATDDNCPDQHSYGCITATNCLLDADEWSPQHDKILPSSQTHHLNRCSVKQQQCSVNIPDKPDTQRLTEQVMYDFPESEPIDQKNDGLSKPESSMDTITDSLTRSSLDISIQFDAERQKTNTLTNVLQPTESKFSGTQHVQGTQHMEVHSPKKLLSNRKEMSPNSQEKLLQALKDCGLDDVIELSNGINKLSFDKDTTKRPLSSIVDYGKTSFGTETKKPKTMNQLLPQLTKGILKSPDIICCNTCCSKNSSIHTHANGAIAFSQRQMQDTESIATKLLEGLNTLKSIVQETLFSEELSSSPSKYNVEEMRLATRRASKLEVTTKKWLAMMSKDCNRFCKIMELVDNKIACTVTDVHKGRKKITFADETGGMLCQVKVYEQQPVAFIVPKN